MCIKHYPSYVRWVSLIVIISLLPSCMAGVSSAWTGAMLIYDRHNVYKKIDDARIAHDANHVLFDDDLLRCKGCAIDLAVFNRIVLLTGHVPTKALRAEANHRVSQVPGINKLYNQIAVAPHCSDHTIQDSWITAKIRSQMMKDAEINPRQFKVVTADGVVYLMGDVLPYQAERVIKISRNTDGVVRVVKLLNYYQVKPAR